MAIQVSMSGLDLSFLRDEPKKGKEGAKLKIEGEPVSDFVQKEVDERPREKVMNKKAKQK